MQNMNERFSKWINMHVGEVVHWLGEHPCKIYSCMDRSEIATKTETNLGKASIYVNDRKCSKKSNK